MKKIRYKGLDLVLTDKNSTGNYKVYKSLNGHNFLFSYDTLIAITDMYGYMIAVTSYYNYSPTTGKHLFKFCDDYAYTTSKVVRAAQKNVSNDERDAKVNACIINIKQNVEGWLV